MWWDEKMVKYNLGKNRIRFKHKGLKKSNDIKIIVIDGKTYIEAVPEKNEDTLSINEINEMYISFIQLGRDLYESNKKSISKIDIENNIFHGQIDGRMLTQDVKLNEIIKKIQDWLRENKLDKSDSQVCKRNNLNYLILNNEEWKPSESLIPWLKSNFIPDIYEGENSDGKYVMYDDGFMVELAIFMYLTIYSIVYTNGQMKKEVCFEDYINFIGIDTSLFTISDYMWYVFDIINFYEKNHTHILHGYDRVINDIDNEFALIHEYESIYGILWYVFKMNINDLLLKDSEQKIIKIQPCKGNCGRLVINNSRCDVCQTDENRKRKQKSEQKKKDGIAEIKHLISVNKYPDEIKRQANSLLSKSFRELKMYEINEVLGILKETN